VVIVLLKPLNIERRNKLAKFIMIKWYQYYR